MEPTSVPAVWASSATRSRKVVMGTHGLSAPVTDIDGVGPARAQRLERLGFTTVGQLLHSSPRQYVDRSRPLLIRELVHEQSATVRGTVGSGRWRRAGRDGSLWLGTAILEDEAGDRLHLLWFSRTRGRRPRHPVVTVDDSRPVTVSGVARRRDGRWHMTAPDIEEDSAESLHTGRIVPFYSLTAGLTQKVMRRIVRSALDQVVPTVDDDLPKRIRQDEQLLEKGEALVQLHFPNDWSHLERARRRLAFDELLFVRLVIDDLSKRRSLSEGKAYALPVASTSSLHRRLPFDLTSAQERVIAEIDRDMNRSTPMYRLLQGDVGSGKTVIAAHALQRAAAAGFQAVLLAPSDILARQHASTLRDWLAGSGLRVDLLRGATPPAERKRLQRRLEEGKPTIVVGTHAVLSDSVRFNRLALLVVDEQHRFGVEQRRRLLKRSPVPHLLIVSATPIPRTLAHSLYGDLDVSFLDEKPPGRKQIDTRWVRPARRDEVYTFVRRQVEAGGQAFVVFPTIGEEGGDDDEQLLAAVRGAAQGPLGGVSTAVVHGRQPSAEQYETMERFHKGEVKVLFATAVIEVGVDVPAATTIVIESADKFGLAQLHQLRGRVGRGGAQAFCFLIADPTTDVARQRLQRLRTTDDGFELAQHDLSLRGPGELLGLRQSGMPDLSPVAQQADGATLQAAQNWAEWLLKTRGRDGPVALWQRVAAAASGVLTDGLDGED